MKLSPSTIAANLSAAAAAEAEAAANSNSATTTNINVTQSFHTHTTTVSTANTLSTPATTSTSAITGSAMASAATVPGNPVGKMTPKDTQVIAAILQDMGIVEYEPRVLPQLVEFSYRYAARVLEDAQLFSAYAKKKVIDTHDVQIAAQMQMERSFVGPPPRGTLLEIARAKNSQPLPTIKSHNGMRLPPDRYSLVAPNVRLASTVNKSSNNNKVSAAPRTGTSLLSKFSTAGYNSTNKGNLSSGNLTQSSNFGSKEVLGIKRRLDES